MLVTIADIAKFIGTGCVFLYKCCRDSPVWNKCCQRENPDDFVSMSDDEEEEEVIPLPFILLIIVGYTLLGAALFPHLEQWNFYEAFYFSFITMSTIGFGDFVPENQDYYLLTLLYVVLGLMITTMCVEFLGSQYIAKIHYFGRKMRRAKNVLRTMGDMMRYTAFIKKKYGVDDDGLKGIRFGTDWDEFFAEKLAYVPKDINIIRYIDQRTTTHGSSSGANEMHSRFSSIPHIDLDGANKPINSIDDQRVNSISQDTATQLSIFDVDPSRL